MRDMRCRGKGKFFWLMEERMILDLEGERMKRETRENEMRRV